MKTIGFLAIVLSACGGVVHDDPTVDAGRKKDAGRDAAKPGLVLDAQSADDAAPADDAYPVFHEDACAAQNNDPLPFECDPLATVPECANGLGCYPLPPRATDGCHPGRYGTLCLRAGSGAQGDPCGSGSDCVGGFICVKSSAGDQCVKLCRVSEFGSCGEGRICREVDVTGSGYGGCE